MLTNHDGLTSYSDQSFWSKRSDCATKAGYQVVEKALWLFYAAQKPDVPLRAKAIIYGALGLVPAEGTQC